MILYRVRKKKTEIRQKVSNCITKSPKIQAHFCAAKIQTVRQKFLHDSKHGGDGDRVLFRLCQSLLRG